MNKLSCKEIIKGLPPVLKETDIVSLDLELANLKEGQLHRPFGRLTSLACSFDGETSYIIFEQDEVQEFLNRIEKATFIFHNAVFDLGHLRRWAKVPERKGMRDIMLIEKLLYSNYYANGEFSLADLVRRYLKCYMPKDIREEFHDLEGAMTPEQIEYASLDVIGTWQVDKEQQKLVEERDMLLWDTMYNPHVWTTLELGGFKLDVDEWIRITKEQQAIVDDVSSVLGKKYGHTEKKMVGRGKERHEEELFVPFNLNSPAQVKQILKQMKIDVESTDDDHIRPYYDTNPFVHDVLDFRKAEKQVSTYGMSFLKCVEDDGRIYTSLNISKAETGRDCIHGDTVLETDMGDFAISDLPLTVIGSCSILTHRGRQQKILRQIYKGKEEMFEVTLDNGSKIKCTKGHKFLTVEGWKHLYELKENDRLLDPPLPNRGTEKDIR